jgi:ribonuclease J
MIESLSLLGADVVYTAVNDALHASGHGNQEDLKFLVRFTDPKYFIPIGGDIRHQLQYEKLCIELGYKKDQVFRLTEGETVWFTKNQAKRGETVKTQSVYVDANGVGDVGSAVLKDREFLSEEGIFVITLVLNQEGTLAAKPKIVSRGFVFEKQDQYLQGKATARIESVIQKQTQPIDSTKLKGKIHSEMADLFYREKGRQPMIVVEIIQL